MMAGVLARFADAPRSPCPTCRDGFRCLAAGLAGRATLVFSTHAPGCHTEEHTYRLLGLAHLGWGNDRLAMKHLEIALSLLRRKAARPQSLSELLRLHCEAGVLRIVLIRLHRKLGEEQAARWLAREAEQTL
jgi:hypothetical protein